MGACSHRSIYLLSTQWAPPTLVHSRLITCGDHNIFATSKNNEYHARLKWYMNIVSLKEQSLFLCVLWPHNFFIILIRSLIEGKSVILTISNICVPMCNAPIRNGRFQVKNKYMGHLCCWGSLVALLRISKSLNNFYVIYSLNYRVWSS